MTSRPSRANTATTPQRSSESDSGKRGGPRFLETDLSASWFQRALPFLFLIGAIVVVFGQVVSFGFAPIDDGIHLSKNPLYNPLTLEHVVQPWREPVLHLYMPATYDFWALEVAVSRSLAGEGQSPFNPAVFHAGNLILHCLNSCLVLVILRLLTRNNLAALLAALFFALHPLQAESVAWISETKGMLCNFFCLAGVALQVGRFQQQPLTKAKDWGLCAGMNLAFMLALLSKPSAIAMIPIMWLIDVGFLRRSVLVSALELTPCALVAALISIVAKSAQGDELLTFTPPLVMRPLIAGDAIAFYLYKLALPFSLSIDYGRAPETVVETPWIWCAWLAPVGVAIVLSFLPNRKTWLFSLAIFVAALLPVSGLVSFLFQYYSTVSDRYVYLGMLGPSIAIAWLFTRYARPNWAFVFLAILCGLAILSARQAATWKSAASLYAQSLRVNPNGFLTQSGLGNLYADENHPREAIEHLTRAAELKPDSSAVHQKLGTLLIGVNRVDEALPHLREAVRLKPDYAEGHNDLGVALGKSGHPLEAIDEFRQAIERKPDDVEFHTNLMIAYSQADQRDQAMATAEKALELARSQRQAQMVANLEAWLNNQRARDHQP